MKDVDKANAGSVLEIEVSRLIRTKSLALFWNFC